MTITVVKDSQSTAVKKLATVLVMNFEERVEWTIANRPHLKSRRHWAKLAKLSEKTLNSAVARSKDGDNYSGSPRLASETSFALCEVAHVDRKWFETGVGTPDLSYAGVEQYDTHGMRRRAAQLLEDADRMDPKEAWWLMRDIEATGDKVTWETFYVAARALIGTGPAAAKAQLSSAKVAGASATIRRR